MKVKQLIISVIALAFLHTAAYGGSWVSGSVKNSFGSRDYKLWVSPGYRKENAIPLVLMLHGCMQKAEDLAAASGMNALADENNFLVVYPEQIPTANPLSCWNWFDPKHQGRDAGEPALIAAVIEDLRSSYNVDAKRIYVVGISAGGAMAVVMAASYPELFAGLGVIAGEEYKAATTVEGGLASMKTGGPDPNQQGLLAYQAMQKSLAGAKKRMPVIAFHGKKDPYLKPLNTDQLIAQWAQTNDYLDDGKDNDSVSVQSPNETKGAVPDGYSYTRGQYKDSNGRLLMEKWIVEGLGHAWPGSPTANQFADPKGPNASAEIWRFFGETNLDSSVSQGTSPTVKPKGGDE
ncbi:MAG TPA: PHB depolymerase family esterase [Pyrinomonadaceae bacterium]|nr:PHB depolymerase family esterase [Pyrinomonadaceae bacterium]